MQLRPDSEVDPTTKEKPSHSSEGLLATKQSDQWRRQKGIVFFNETVKCLEITL